MRTAEQETIMASGPAGKYAHPPGRGGTVLHPLRRPVPEGRRNHWDGDASQRHAGRPVLPSGAAAAWQARRGGNLAVTVDFSSQDRPGIWSGCSPTPSSRCHPRWSLPNAAAQRNSPAPVRWAETWSSGGGRQGRTDDVQTGDNAAMVDTS